MCRTALLSERRKWGDSINLLNFDFGVAVSDGLRTPELCNQVTD
jgi:hypothetical protein